MFSPSLLVTRWRYRKESGGALNAPPLLLTYLGVDAGEVDAAAIVCGIPHTTAGESYLPNPCDSLVSSVVLRNLDTQLRVQGGHHDGAVLAEVNAFPEQTAFTGAEGGLVIGR